MPKKKKSLEEHQKDHLPATWSASKALVARRNELIASFVELEKKSNETQQLLAQIQKSMSENGGAISENFHMMMKDAGIPEGASDIKYDNELGVFMKVNE